MKESFEFVNRLRRVARCIIQVCFLCCALVHVATAEEGAADDAERPSLEALKTIGAERSGYLRPLQNSKSTEVPQPQLAAFNKQIQPILARACVGCHGEEAQEGNIRIDTLDPNLHEGDDVSWWLEVMAVLSNGEMPPPDEPPLADSERTKIIDWLAQEIQVASTVRRASGGHSSFRRMTRYEYNYALQDILGLPWQFAKDLPPEANSEDGFQNSSDLLHMTVEQIDMYRRIALKALQRATVIGEQPPTLHWGVSMRDAAAIEWPKQQESLKKLKEKHKDDPEKLKQELERLTASFKQPHRNSYYRELTTERTARSSWAYYGAKYAFAPANDPPKFPGSFDTVAVIPQGRNQHLIVELGDQLPDEGMMRVRVRASRTAKDAEHIPSLRLDFGWRASNEGRSEIRVSKQDTPVQAELGAPQIYEWDVPLGEIYPRNSVRGISKMGQMPSPSEYIRISNGAVSKGEFQLDFVSVSAPVFDQWPPASHARIFIDSDSRSDETSYVREILTAMMTRAWRREVSEQEVDKKLRLYDAMRGECDSMEEAVVEVLATVLASPNLLYLVQRGSTSSGEDTDARQPLSSIELATRLAIFLWSSVPDTELLQLANSGELNNAETLASQVSRMLADPKAKRFAKHFVRQWLDMQLLDFLNIDRKAHGYFDPTLKEAMQEEPIALFHQMLSNNESVLNFIHSDYTMVNERLAVHYGLPNVTGNHFRRVNLDPNRNRGGLLTQAGLLAMNSDGKDSHPLKRGVWLLKSLLNDPPPPPPPAVPEIDLADPEIAKMTLKQRIEDHRNHAACMSCHAKIDPWGIAFENYDATGRWRQQINGQPVDATSQLFNKQPLSGIDGLKRFLLTNRQDQFVRALVDRMATYALGRPLTFADRADIDKITAQVRKQHDGLASLVQAVVASELFQSK